MSWDADLLIPGEEDEYNPYCWNYTHNTNGMINQALHTQRAGEKYNVASAVLFGTAPSWWRLLDGMSGDAGHVLLAAIVHELEATPVYYRMQNPDNGWGSYDSLLRVLRQMRDRSAEHPEAQWAVSG